MLEENKGTATVLPNAKPLRFWKQLCEYLNDSNEQAACFNP